MLRKKRAITLLEIMIVIFLIGIIGSVIGYNMKGSLEKGKIFKTTQAQEQIRNVLLLEVAQDRATLGQVVENPEKYLKNSDLIKNSKEILKDGWGKTFEIKIVDDNDLQVISENLLKVQKNKINEQEESEEL